MRYRVRHLTSCSYDDDIVVAHHLLHLRPRPLPNQRVHGFRMEIDPAPTSTGEFTDYFGNPTTYVAFEEPHRDLAVRTEMEIDVTAPPLPALPDTPAWEALRQSLRDPANADSRDAARFAYPTVLTPPLPRLAAFARPCFAPGRPVGVAAAELVELIHDEFIFDPEATSVATPVEEVFELGRGVCQDFAHLAVGSLRAMGLAARYVSGYLRTVPPPGKPRLIGADASHAWVSVWCGDGLWMEFDPTNGRVGAEDLITLCWGRDYDDVAPMRGVLMGGGSQGLKVEIDVEPLGASASA